MHHRIRNRLAQHLLWNLAYVFAPSTPNDAIGSEVLDHGANGFLHHLAQGALADDPVKKAGKSRDGLLRPRMHRYVHNEARVKLLGIFSERQKPRHQHIPAPVRHVKAGKLGHAVVNTFQSLGTLPLLAQYKVIYKPLVQIDCGRPQKPPLDRRAMV